MTQVIPQCSACKNFFNSIKVRNACRAYRDNIPVEIFINERDHRKPQPGDNGIQFEPLPNQKSPLEG